MILYNGSSGGLRRYFASALKGAAVEGIPLQARLEDRTRLQQELKALEPSGSVTLVQMAARVPVAACEVDPEGTWQTNVRDTRETVARVVAWAQARGLPTSVLYVSSGHVYAAREPGHRLRETDPTAPRSVYARTKLAAEEALSLLAAEKGFSLRVARVFGLVAPSQPPSYVLPGLVARVRERRFEAVPGLDYVRDYLDSRDVCAGLVALCDSPPAAGSTEYVNLCSGETTSLRELLGLVTRTLLPAEADRILETVRAGTGRPDDIPWMVGDPQRFLELTGKQPRRIPLEETVRDACAVA